MDVTNEMVEAALNELFYGLNELFYGRGAISEDVVRAALEAALAAAPQVEQEPYCYIYEYDGAFGLHREFYPGTYNGKKPSRTVPLYTSPPQRKPLTEEEIEVLDCIPNVPGILIGDVVKFARAIERAHGIGGSK